MSISAIDLAERGWLPDSLIRVGIRRLLSQRLRHLRSGLTATEAERQLAGQLRSAPMVVHARSANEQHYEVPAEFFSACSVPI